MLPEHERLKTDRAAVPQPISLLLPPLDVVAVVAQPVRRITAVYDDAVGLVEVVAVDTTLLLGQKPLA